jgi:hypothetical protein
MTALESQAQEEPVTVPDINKERRAERIEDSMRRVAAVLNGRQTGALAIQ